MADVSIRDLRNHGGEVVDRVAAGKRVIVTRNGKPVAELRPIRKGLPTAVVLEHRRRLPAMDPVRLRTDIDTVLDTSL